MGDTAVLGTRKLKNNSYIGNSGTGSSILSGGHLHNTLSGFVKAEKFLPYET